MNLIVVPPSIYTTNDGWRDRHVPTVFIEIRKPRPDPLLNPAAQRVQEQPRGGHIAPDSQLTY